ncbi:hypothetical protein LJC74_10485 [Eubacteriales bacterium OttesenSCG-928-A19]|nr:hypothetical protein [Eubacteriales bacterium OttesenSCG-928-A19]
MRVQVAVVPATVNARGAQRGLVVRAVEVEAVAAERELDVHDLRPADALADLIGRAEEDVIRAEHGLDKLRGETGMLWVRGTLAAGMIRFEVRDNGPGFSEESLRDALTKGSQHYCLKNIDERLRLVYGDGYEFMLGNGEARGAVVVVELPVDGPRMMV